MMEFVDFNETLGGGKLVAKEAATAKRTRRGSKKETTAITETPAAKAPKAAPIVMKFTEEIQETEVVVETEVVEPTAEMEAEPTAEVEGEEKPKTEE